MNDWQPIETAPKDRRILVITKRGAMYAAEWSKNPYTDHEAWLIARIDNQNGDCLITQATHWMPLPPPPKGDQA